MIRNVQLVKLIFLLAFFSGLSLLSSNRVYGQVQNAMKTSTGIGYLEYLPPGYSENTDHKYPIIIFLHGIGERGDGSPESLEDVKKNGPPRNIKDGHNMCFNVNGVEECFIVISPQLPSGGWSASFVNKVINHALETYRVDEDRVYLTGLSLGGRGVWAFAQSSYNNPNKLAAIAPVASWGNEENICFLAENHVAVWGFHGDADGTISYKSGLAQIEALKACVPSPDPEPKFTLYSGVGHNSWTRAYRTDHSLHDPNVFEWLLMQRKGGAQSAPAAPLPANLPPVVSLGSDINITLPDHENSVKITAKASDSDGEIETYSWAQTSGATTLMAGKNSATLTVDNLEVGTYSFKLTVTDNRGASAAAKINVVVDERPNVPPVVKTSGEMNIVASISDVFELTGTVTDEDGSIVSYDWTQEAGEKATIISVDKNTLVVSNLYPGSYTFRLTVKDDRGASAFDEILLHVKAPNVAPTVSAGNDQTIELPENMVELTGEANDSDGEIVSYQWKQLSGLPATITSANNKNCEVSELAEGTYSFALIVEDNEGVKATDQINITVNPEPKGEPGLVYSYYEGFWGKIPRFDEIVPVRIGKISNFDLSPRLQDDYFAFTYDGYIEIKSSGKYRFYLNSSDGSKLFINGEEVVRNDYVHRPREKYGDITLSAGMHQIQVLFFEKEDKEILDIFYEGPGMNKQLIPDNVLFTNKNQDNMAPISNAGEDIFISMPTSETTLIGAGFDPDGSIASYVWKQVAGDPVEIISSNGNELQIAGLTEGIYRFKLTVRDNNGETDSDYVKVKVTDDVHGVNYSYYEGDWDQLPDFDKMTPKATGVVENFNLSKRLEVNYFGFKFESYLEIAEEGDYTFYLTSDDGSQLFIDSNLKIDNDMVHTRKTRTKRIHMTAGLHPIRIDYFDKRSGEALILEWSGPGFERKTVPFEVLYKNADITSAVALSTSEQEINVVNNLNVYPNPVQQTMYVDFEEQLEGLVTIQILDQNGQLIYSEIKDLEVENSIAINVDDFNLSMGVFYINAIDTFGNKKTIRIYKE